VLVTAPECFFRAFPFITLHVQLLCSAPAYAAWAIRAGLGHNERPASGVSALESGEETRQPKSASATKLSAHSVASAQHFEPHFPTCDQHHRLKQRGQVIGQALRIEGRSAHDSADPQTRAHRLESGGLRGSRRRRCRRPRLSDAHWTEGPPLDVGDPRKQGQQSGAWLRGDTRAAMAAFAKSSRVSFDFDVVQNGRDIPNWGCAPK
jgi:hypothetical protein